MKGSYGWMPFALALAGAADAADERGLTYPEVMRAVSDTHPLVAGAAGAQQAAEGELLVSQSVFDPLWRTDGVWTTSRERQFLPYTFDATQRAWDLFTNVEGTAATGTRWSLGAGLDYLNARTVSGTVDTFGSRVFATLSQELLRGATLAYNLQTVRASRHAVDAATHTAEAARQDALAGAAVSYWNWVEARGAAEIADSSAARAEEWLEIARAAAGRGAIATAWVARFEADAAAAHSAASAASVSAGQAEDQVRAWLGEPAGEGWIPTTSPGEPAASTLDPDAVRSAVNDASPALRAARARAEAARATERGARVSRLPSLTASATAGVAARDETPSAATSGLFDADNLPYAELGGSLLVPIGNRAGRGDQMRAEGQLAAAEAVVANLERQAQAQATGSLRAMAAAQEQIALADTQVRAMGEALNAEREALNQGASHPQFVLEQRRALDSAQREALAARTRWRVALTELQRLQGSLGTELP